MYTNYENNSEIENQLIARMFVSEGNERDCACVLYDAAMAAQKQRQREPENGSIFWLLFSMIRQYFELKNTFGLQQHASICW